MKKTLERQSGSLWETISIFFLVSSQLTVVYLYQLHLQKLKFIKMAESLTGIILSNTSDNDISMERERLIISSDLEGNDKTRNENEEKPLPDELASFTPTVNSAIDNIRNIKCSPDIDAIYLYVSETVATKVDRDFIETVVVEPVNKNITFHKPKVQGLDSYFIVNAKENSEVMNSTIANENVNSNSNISSDINKSSSNENTPGKTHADNIKKESTIQYSAFAN